MAAIPRANGAYVSALRTEDMLYDLYQGLADRYIKEHGDEFKTDAEREAARKKFLEENNGAVEAVSKASARIVDTNWGMVETALKPKRNTPQVDERTKAAYGNIVKAGFTKELLDVLKTDPLALRRKQGGVELMEGATAFAHSLSFTPTRKFGIFGNIQAEKDAYQNILAKKGKFIEYDLEGIEKFITQYAFAEMDRNKKGPIKTSMDKMVTGVIGLTERGENEILKIVDKYDHEGMRVTGWKGLEEKYRYVMDELLKYGMSKWHVDKGTGRVILDEYASNEDIRKLDLDPKKRMETIRQGVKNLREINKSATQEKVEFMGEQVYGYERDILHQLELAKKGDKNALTMVSTNGLFYDAQKIEGMFGVNGWASEGGIRAFQKLTGKTGSIQTATHQLDMTSIGRALASANLPLQYREAAAEVARRGETFNTSTGNSLVYLGKEGMQKVQDAIDETLAGVGQKHSAPADILMQGSTHAAMLDRWDNIDQKYIERLFSKSKGPYEGREDASIFGRANKDIHAEYGSVFHIRNGQFAQRGYGISFVHDAISDEDRFAGNVRVNGAGEARTDIVSQGVKKGSTAVMLSDVVEYQLDPTTKRGKYIYDQLDRAGINPVGEKLYAIRFGLVGEPSYAKNDYVQIGTRDQIMRMFQDNDYIGKFDVQAYKEQAQKNANREAKRAAESHVTLSALAKNRDDILRAHAKGLVPDYVADAVKRFDYWTISVKADLLKEKAAHYASYEKQKAALTKSLGKTKEQIDYILSQAFNMTSYGMNDEELFKAYRSARKDAAKANAKRKDAKVPRDSALEHLNKLYDEKAALKAKRDDLNKQLNKAYEAMNALKPENGWLFEDGKMPDGYAEFSEAEGRFYDLKQQHDDAKLAYQDAVERFKGAHKEYSKWNKQYQIFREKYEDKLGVRDVFGNADQELRDNIRHALELRNEKLAPLFQLEDEHQTWLKSYNDRLQNGGRIQSAETPKQAPAPALNLTTADIENAMLSAENGWAVDTSEVSDDVRKALGTKGKDGKYKLNVRAIEKRSEAVVQEDTAGNWIRGLNYTRSGRAIDLLHAFTKFKDFFGLDRNVVTAEQRNRTMKYIIEAYQHGDESELTKDMDGAQLSSYKKLVESVHGVMFNKEGKHEFDVYPNTLRNFGQSYRWLMEMEPIITKVRKEAYRLGDSEETRNAYFEEIFQNVLAATTQEVNKKFRENGIDRRFRMEDAIGRSPYSLEMTMEDAIGRSPYSLEMTKEEMDSFEVDLSSILAPAKSATTQDLGAKEKDLFKINLEEPDSFGKRLANAMGLHHTDRQGVIMSALHDFADTIYIQYKDVDPELEKKIRVLSGTSTQEFSQEWMQAQIVRGLKAIRNYVPDAGLPDAVRLMDIYHAPAPIQTLKKLEGKNFDKSMDGIVGRAANDPTLTKFVSKKANPEDLAKTLTDSLFQKTQSVTREKLQRYGYDNDRITEILQQREQRKWETQVFMTELFKGTYKDNRYVGYGYSDDGRLVFRTSTNEELDVTHLLPFDRFDEKTGQFYTAIGGRSISSKQILSTTAGSQGSGLALHSLINEYTKSLTSKINYANSSRRSDSENLNNIGHFMSEALNSIADMAFTKYDKADAREGEFIDLTNFYKRLGMYADKGAYSNIRLNEKTQELLYQLMHQYLRQNPDPEHNPANIELPNFTATQWSVIYNDLDRLLAPLADKDSMLSRIVFDSDEDWEKFQGLLKHVTTTGIRHPEDGYVALSTQNMPFLAGFYADKRYVNQVIMRTKEFDEEGIKEMRELLGKDSRLKSITREGSVVMTSEEAEQARNGIARPKTFRTTHLTMTQSELEKVLGTKKAQDAMQKLGISAHEFYTYIGESGSISNPEYLRLFRKNIQQRERTNSLIDMDETMRKTIGDEAFQRENEIRHRTQDVITWDKDKGQVNFQYSKDDSVLIKKGDVYAWEKSYTGGEDKQIADRTGFITRRYYNRNGDRVSAEEINQVLAQPENAKQLQAIQAAAASGNDGLLRRTVNNILEGAGYQQRYEIESVDYKPYRKILSNMEKSVSKFLMPALGQLEDSKVGEALGGVTKEKIEAALPAFLSPTVLRSMDRTNAVLKDAGLQEFKDEKAWMRFRNAIDADNKNFWNTFTGIFRDLGYIGKNQELGMVSTLENEMAKGSHNELGGRVMGTINEAVELLARAKAGGGAATDKNYADASAEIRDALIKHKVFTDVDGNNVVKKGRDGLGNESIEIGHTTAFDESKFNSIMTAYHPDYASNDKYQTPDGMQRAQVVKPMGGTGLGAIRIQGQTVDGVYHYTNGVRDAKLGIGQIRAVDDADEGRLNNGGKGGIKLTRRFFAAADQDVVEMASLLKEAHALTRMENSEFGHGFDAQAEFNRMYRGIATAKRDENGRLSISMEPMKEGQNVRRVNAPIIRNLKEELVAGADGHRQYGVNEAGNERFFKTLEREGISRETAEGIVDTYKNRGYSLIGADFVKSNHAYASGLAAMNFNNEIQSATTEEQKQAIIKKYTGENSLLGQYVINIKDADFSTRGNAMNANNLTERAGIVQIGDQYVAIGYQPSTMMDNQHGTGTASTTKLRDTMQTIQSQHRNIIDSNYKGDSEEFGNIDKTIEAARSEVVRSVSSKDGAIAQGSTGYLKGSGMFKGGIIRTDGGHVVEKENYGDLTTKVKGNPLLAQAKVGSKSILEHEAAGNHINAVWVGKDYFENLVKGASFQQGLAAIKGYDSVDQITQEDNQEALAKLLKQASSDGGIGVGGRQPMEYEGSVQGLRIFYGKGIASNEMLLTESAAKAMKLDKDGDNGYVGATREQVNIKDANGNMIVENARMSQFETAGLNTVAGGSLDIQYKNNGSIYDEIEGAAGITANSTQSGFAKSDYDRKTHQFQTAETGIKGGQEHPEIRVGGKIYNVSGQDIGPDKRAQIRNDFEELIGSNQNFQNFVSGNQEFQSFMKDSGIAKIADMTAMQFAGSGQADKFISYMEQNVGVDEAKHFADLIGNAASVESIGTENSKLVMNADTGLANMEVYRSKRLISNLEAKGETNLQAGDKHIINHFMEHANEAFQAPKNSTATGVFTPEEFGSAIKDFFGVNRARVRRTEPLMNMIESMHSAGIKELFNVPVQEGIEPGPDGMISAERVQQAFMNVLPENRVITQQAFEQARVGYTDKKGIEPKFAESNEADIKSDLDAAANEQLRKAGLGDIQLIEGPLTAESRGVVHHQQDLGLDDIFDEKKVINAAEESMDLGDAVKGAFSTLGHALNHGGAKAMLGFAGAMMMAGMAGGAPTSPTPAQGQAKGIQSENAMYSIPSTMPSAGGNSQPQSYIINVNASTDRGRDFATQAINQAMSRFPQTSNGNRMTMNVNDSSSNIGLGDIGNYISSML